MTIVDNYFPFDTGPGAAATAARWRLMARLFSGSGVIPGYLQQMNPTIAGSVVTIDTGAVWIDGYYGESDSPKTVGVSGNGTVVAHMDPNARQIVLQYLASPATPTQSLTGVYEIPIAQVTGSTILDVRQFAVEASTAVPSGSIFDYGGGTVPVGWLPCNGQSVLRSLYPTLFAAIGTSWGTPTDGSHFTIPNLAGRVGVGVGGPYAMGAYGGEAAHQLSIAELAQHGHQNVSGAANSNQQHAHATNANGNTSYQAVYTSPVGTGYSVVNPGGAGNVAIGWNAGYGTAQTNTDHTHNIPLDGSNNAHNNMQPYGVVQKMIKT